MFIGSDGLALGPFTNKVTYLEDGDYVIATHEGARIFDGSGKGVERPIKIVPASAVLM